jgi:hypothetical protein
MEVAKYLPYTKGRDSGRATPEIGAGTRYEWLSMNVPFEPMRAIASRMADRCCEDQYLLFE